MPHTTVRVILLRLWLWATVEAPIASLWLSEDGSRLASAVGTEVAVWDFDAMRDGGCMQNLGDLRVTSRDV